MYYFDKFTDTIQQSTEKIKKISSEFIEIGKVNLIIYKKKDEIYQKYERIGEYVYQKFKKSSYVAREELNTWLKEIQELEKEIETLRIFAARIKKIKYCSECQAELEMNMTYCPYCGKFISD